jgi:hypothetical protein
MRVRIRLSAASFAVCIVVMLGFPYTLEVRNSNAQDQSARPVIGNVPRSPVPTLNPSAPAFALAARQGVAEMLGSGGQSFLSWNSYTGLWGGHTKPNWWQSALAVLTLVRYAERIHSLSPAYQRVLSRLYDYNVHKPRHSARHFANEFMDDTAWWGLAWLEASKYELYYRHDTADAAKFLGVAEWDARYINAVPRQCGGIRWAVNRPPDSVTSAEFIALAAELTSYRNSPGMFYDPQQASIWLADASAALAWLEETQLVNLRAGTVIDGLTASCQRTGGAMTYTEGEMADALVQLGSALHDPSYYAYAAHFLRYALTPGSGLDAHGILQERCESWPGRCDRLGYRLDLPAYKGVFVNAVSDWSSATHSTAFSSFLRAQAVAVVNNAIRAANGLPGHCGTPQSCQFAFSWTGRRPAQIGVTVGGQVSGIDALTAVLPTKSF